MFDLRMKDNTYNGTLIVFEGTDGAGKTTMIAKTKEYLSERFGAERILIEKQPTDLSRKTRLFQKMMYCSKHEEINYRAVQLLTLSDRVQHNHEVIIPALKEGKIIICDRYLYTSIANMLARGYRSETWFFDACKEIVKPDITFLAYVEPKLAIERIRSRPEECNRHLDEELLQNVAKEFLSMREQADFHTLDTSKNADVAFSQVKNELDIYFEGKNE